MTYEKTTSAAEAQHDPTAPQRSRSAESEAAFAAVAQAVRTVNVWCAAAVSEDDLSCGNCGALQVTARATAESLAEASEHLEGQDNYMQLLYGVQFLDLVEGALWNLSTNVVAMPPARGDLIATMEKARGHLEKFLAVQRDVTCEAEVAHG